MEGRKMLTTKRVIIATICGFVFGIVCMLLASSNPNPAHPVTTITKWTIIISRTMLGFTIGISAIRLKWWLHGIVLGAIASIPMAVPIIDRLGIAIGSIVMGIIYGFLTELITSILFKARSAALS
jgi:MFS family permease